MPPLDSTAQPDTDDDIPGTAQAAAASAPAPAISIPTIRQKYPQYQDLSDDQLAQGLHKKFYADMPFDQFASKIGYQAPTVSTRFPGSVDPDAAPLRRIGQAALEGASSDEENTVISPQSMEWLRNNGFLSSDKNRTWATVFNDALAALPDVANRGMSGFLRGLQQSVVEMGVGLGMSPQAARDLAAFPEAFPTDVARSSRTAHGRAKR